MDLIVTNPTDGINNVPQGEEQPIVLKQPIIFI